MSGGGGGGGIYLEESTTQLEPVLGKSYKTQGWGMSGGHTPKGHHAGSSDIKILFQQQDLGEEHLVILLTGYSMSGFCAS